MIKLSLLRCAVLLLVFITAGALYTVTPLAAQQGVPIATDVVLTGSLNDAPRPHAQAVRATGSIDIDGQLDEASWDAAFVIDRFVQQRPNAGAPVSERTEVRILYDDENFYVGAEFYDRNPSGIIRSPLQRDGPTPNGDAFAISLDTFLDGRNAAVFFINAGGTIRDTQSADDGRAQNLAWNSAGNVKTRVHELGWTVEFAIPWSSLRFEGSREEQIWGLNLFRRIRRKNEEATWSPMDRGWNVYNVSRSGTLGGLDGIRTGSQPVTEALRGLRPVDRIPPAGDGLGCRWRGRYQVRDHTGHHPRPVAQHRLLAGGGGPTAGEPDPLFPSSFRSAASSSWKTRPSSSSAISRRGDSAAERPVGTSPSSTRAASAFRPRARRCPSSGAAGSAARRGQSRWGCSTCRPAATALLPPRTSPWLGSVGPSTPTSQPVRSW